MASTSKTASFTSQMRFCTPVSQVMQTSTVGCPKETMSSEFRVGLIPATVRELVSNGHKVFVESGAGLASGFTDSSYVDSGATIVMDSATLYSSSQVIVKVQAPQPQEYSYIQPGQVIFAFFNFETNETLFSAMMQQQAICFDYQYMQTEQGMFPVLQSMCEISGRLSISQAMKYLEKTMGGSGCMLGSVPGVENSGRVLILGGGAAAMQAARVASSTGAQVCVMDVSMSNMKSISESLPSNCSTMLYCTENLVNQLQQADVVIGTVLGWLGSTSSNVSSNVSSTQQLMKAPVLVTKEQVSLMKPGSVIVDLAISRGGNFESSQPTTVGMPTFLWSNVTHYCATNLPSIVPRTSSVALSNSALVFIQQVANSGWQRACVENSALMQGLMMVQNTTTSYMLSQVYSSSNYVPTEQVLQSVITSLNSQSNTDSTLVSLKQQLQQLQTSSGSSMYVVEA